jgi:transcriptional regulator with XRE-family HTH domain
MIDFVSSEIEMVNRRSYDSKPITGAQIRAARALVGWTAEDLAREAMLGVATIRRAEAVDGTVQMTAANLHSVLSSFQRVGVHFVREEGKGFGVFLSIKPKET